MKKELIVGLLEKFEKAAYEYKGIECWSARELREILGYSQWRNFVNAVDKAKEACKKVKRRLESEEKKVSKTTKKLNKND